MNGLEIFGASPHFAGSYEDDGTHAGHTLAACPFCDSENLELKNTHTPSYWVSCEDCGAEAHGEYVAGSSGFIKTKAEALRLHTLAAAGAASAWNCRAPAWQPIATAPRDGSPMLLRFGEDHASQGWFVKGSPYPWSFIDAVSGGYGLNTAVDGPGGPSHWMAMPTVSGGFAQGAPDASAPLTNDQLDALIDPILRAAGSALRHYTMQKSRDDMRQAMRDALAQASSGDKS